MTSRYTSQSLLFSLVPAVLAAVGCYDGATAPVASGPPASFGVTQSGAQDFAEFKAIVERGGIPAPEVLDELGFLAEHKLDLPPASCGERLCVHAKLGVMRNLLNGANCTMVFVGLNSPVRPDLLPRPDLHVVLAVDASADPVTTQRAVRGMLLRLRPGDRVSVVRTDGAPSARGVSAASLTEPAILDALEGSAKPSAAALYDGLRAAAEQARAVSGVQGRVVYLGSGRNPPGLDAAFSPAQLAAMVRAYTVTGVGFTFVGLGPEADGRTLRGLAMAAGGNSYMARTAAEAELILSTEADTALFPLARELELSLAAGQDYLVRAVYGAADATRTEREATVRAPALYLGHRTSANDPGANRRGGGGGLMFELIPLHADAAPVGPAPDVGRLTASWRDGESGEPKGMATTVRAQGAVDVDQGQFSDATAAKAFVMTNIYAGLALGVRQAADGDPSRALQTLQALATGMRRWLTTTPDPDITADLAVVDRLITNLQLDGAQADSTRPPVNPWSRD